MIYETFLSSTLEVSDSSRAIVDPFSQLVSGAHKARSILLRTNPLDNGVAIALDLSSDGYASQPTDTPWQQFIQSLIDPYNFSVSLSIPELSGSTKLGVGNISIRNSDGRFDSHARMDWLGVEQNLYLGPPEPASLVQFTKVSKSVSAGVSWNLDRINILSRDIQFRLQRSLHKHRYRGTGAALRLNGTTQYGSSTMACPAGSITFTGSINPTATISTQRNIVGYRNGGSAGNRLLDIGRAGTDRLGWAVRNDAGTQFVCDSPTAITNGGLNDYAAVLDTVNNQLRLYQRASHVTNDFTLVATTAISGTWNTVLSNYTVGRLPDAASNFLQGDIDEVRLYSTALTLNDLEGVFAREALGVETNLYSYYKFNEGSGTSAANTVSGKPALTLTGSPTWVGSLEGDSSLSGTVKPVALGVCRQVEPKWVDTQRLVVQFHDGSMQGIITLRDSGDSITFGSDLSDIYSSTPAAGTYNTCKAKGLARLGSSPVGVITADIQGDNSGIIGYADTASEIDRKLMVDYGDLDNSTEIDDFAYDTLNDANSATTGKYYSSDIRIDAASNEVLSDIRAWGGPTRIGVKTVGRIDDPINLTPTVDWTISDLEQTSSSYSRSPFGIRYKEIVIGYKPYYRVLSPDQVAGVVGLSVKDDFGKNYRYVSKIIPGASEDGNTLTILTSMDSEADARLEMERLASFLSRDLEVVSISQSQGLLTHFIGTVVTLTIVQKLASGEEIYRYDTESKPYVVVAVQESIAAGQPDRFNSVLIG